MPVTISARVPDATAQQLRDQAILEQRTVSEIAARAIDEYLRAERFPGIVFVTGASGRRKSKVANGLDVWEHVLVARGYDWDTEKTARHLSQPTARVELALAYYRAYPTEVDARLRRMEDVEADPQRSLPGALVLKV
jgi:hypothetical protein